MENNRSILAEAENKIEKTRKALSSIRYLAEETTAKELFDYMTGDTFSGDKTTLEDVLGNEYLLVHELVEVNELKKLGRTINKRVIVDSPKAVIYSAHLTAMEAELIYALRKRDYSWVKIRLKQHKENILDNDPNLPDKIRPRAEELFKNFCKFIQIENTKNFDCSL